MPRRSCCLTPTSTTLPTREAGGGGGACCMACILGVAGRPCCRRSRATAAVDSSISSGALPCQLHLPCKKLRFPLLYQLPFQLLRRLQAQARLVRSVSTFQLRLVVQPCAWVADVCLAPALRRQQAGPGCSQGAMHHLPACCCPTCCGCCVCCNSFARGLFSFN